MNRKYSPEMRERALRMLAEARPEHPNMMSAVRHVAGLLGMSPETLRLWQRRYEVDAGVTPGLTTDAAAEIKRLQKENAELRKANEMADSTGQRNGCCEMKQTLISGGIGCRASMGISVASRSSSLSVSTRRGGGSSISPGRLAARRRWLGRWPGKVVTSMRSRSGGSRARAI